MNQEDVELYVKLHEEVDDKVNEILRKIKSQDPLTYHYFQYIDFVGVENGFVECFGEEDGYGYRGEQHSYRFPVEFLYNEQTLLLELERINNFKEKRESRVLAEQQEREENVKAWKEFEEWKRNKEAQQ